MSSLPASIKRIGSKTTEKGGDIVFPHYKSTMAFCCQETQSFDPIYPKILCSLSPTPLMLHIKIGQLASEIFKFESVDDGRRRWRMTTYHWYTIRSPSEPLAQVSWKKKCIPCNLHNVHFLSFYKPYHDWVLDLGTLTLCCHGNDLDLHHSQRQSLSLYVV